MKKMVELTKEFLERSGIDKVYLCKFVFVPNAKGETRDEFIKRVDEFSQSLMGSKSLSPQLSLYYIFDDCESDESFKNGNFGILGKNIVHSSLIYVNNNDYPDEGELDGESLFREPFEIDLPLDDDDDDDDSECKATRPSKNINLRALRRCFIEFANKFHNKGLNSPKLYVLENHLDCL